MIFETYFALILFLIICIFFGISTNCFFKFTDYFESKLYRLFSLISVGFAIFFIMIFIFGICRIPLNIWFFLIISSIIPIFLLIKNKINISFNRPNVYQIILLIVLTIFFIFMLKGTFSYPWIEDDDPWFYAMGAKYISINQDYHSYGNSVIAGYYLVPNSPPGLSTLLGLLHQITPDLYSLMKIFICLILLMGIISFFLFCYIFSEKNIQFSLIATTILIMVPCYVSHFIFNYTLSITILMTFLFTLSLSFLKFKNVFLAGIMCGSLILSHPITAIQTSIILFIIMMIYLFKDKNISLRILIIGFIGLLFSSLLYGDIVINGGFDDMIKKAGGSGGLLSFNYTMNSYDIEDKTLKDFFYAKNISRVDQEEGVGLVLFSICLVGVIFVFFNKKILYKNNFIYFIIFLWYFIFLWILTGGYFRFSVQNYRWWSIFAIFIALHSASTIMIVMNSLKNKIFKTIILSIIFIGIIFTSAVPRYIVQTSQWTPGYGWYTYDEVIGYSSLRQLGFDKNVFSLCSNKGIIANNQMNYPWEKEVYGYFDYVNNQSIVKTSDEILKKVDYIKTKYDIDYLIISSWCVNTLGVDMTNELSRYYLSNSDYNLNVKMSNQAFLLFEVK